MGELSLIHILLLRALCDTNLDCVNHGEGGVSVINDFDRIVYTGYDNSRHICAVIAVDRFCAAAPHEQPPSDVHVVQHDFSIRYTAADDKITIHGQVFQFNVSSANQYAALDVFVVGSFYRCLLYTSRQL